MILFIDTWGWINIFNRRESHHQQVSQYYQEARNKQTTIVTTDYVLDEVYTLIFKRLSADLARQAVETISDTVANGSSISYGLLRNYLKPLKIYD